jgi:hypothetical protein
VILRNLTRRLNRGDLFSSIRIQQSFEQFQKGDSIAEKMKSNATGEEFGKNQLLQVKMNQPPSPNRRDGIVDTKKADYVVHTEKKPTPSN